MATRLTVPQLLISDLPSISSFRICSRDANIASQFCFWRRLRFRNFYDGESTDPNLAYMIPDAEEIITRIVNRILDPNDPFRTYTRRLTIGTIAHSRLSVSFDHLNELKPLPPFLTAETLVRILDCFTKLQDLRYVSKLNVICYDSQLGPNPQNCAFRWQLSSGMPPEVLLALHSRWPQARLHYSLENRTTMHSQWPRTRLHSSHESRVFRAFWGLDRILLQSPQLYSLIIKQYGVGRTEDMADITELISVGGDLRVLHNLADSSHRFDSRLDIRPGHTHIPPLKDLWISHSYNLSREHVELWLNAMDWSGLRSLRIAESHSMELIPAIRSAVPGLKRFTITTGPRRALLTFSPTDLVTFFHSIKALEDVTIYSRMAIEVESVCLALIKSHGKSLRKLRLSRVDYDFSKGMDWTRLLPLLSQTEFVEELELDLSFDREVIEGRMEQIWVSSVTSI
jgi:hypothetical protein